MSTRRRNGSSGDASSVLRLPNHTRPVKLRILLPKRSRPLRIMPKLYPPRASPSTRFKVEHVPDDLRRKEAIYFCN